MPRASLRSVSFQPDGNPRKPAKRASSRSSIWIIFLPFSRILPKCVVHSFKLARLRVATTRLEADVDHQHDPGNAHTCDLKTFPKSVGLARICGRRIKLNRKADRPTLLTPEWVVQTNVLDGTLRQIFPSDTFGWRSQKCVSEHPTEMNLGFHYDLGFQDDLGFQYDLGFQDDFGLRMTLG
jgi:hypothetical protein